jgi:hypothetical protein
MQRSDMKWARRDLLKGAVAASLGSMATPASFAAADETKRQRNLISEENSKLGTPDWQLKRLALQGDPQLRSKFIEGYCSHQSITAGETLKIMVSVAPECEITIEIFRMGYYGGAGARKMTEYGPLAARTQPDPEVGPRRVRECRWEPSLEITIPHNWPSGVYLSRLSRVSSDELHAPWQNYVIFIIKDDRPADILFQCSDNTWQAYNRWPSTFCLYDDGSFDDAKNKDGWTILPGIDVSFDRPYARSRHHETSPLTSGSGEFLSWEFPLCYWLEQQGYDVTYCSNSDMLTPDRGLKCKTFLSVGHDEYWDVRQYDSVMKMIEQGVSALFLCGNSVCFTSPFSAASDGRPNRVITRSGTFGGLSEKEAAILKGFDDVGPDERLLVGARTIIPFNGGGDWIITNPDHWIFRDTGVMKGDAIPGLVGWEFHGEPADLPGLEVVAEGTALAGGVFPAHWTATVYPGPKNNFVFNAATIWWSQGLSSPPGHVLPFSHGTRPHGPDPRVQRITANAIERAIGSA